MTNLPFEQLAYEFHEIWDKAWSPAEDHERIRKLAELVPRSTKSLLDLGCGNGFFLNYLQAEHAQHYSRLTGIDRSNAAPAHVKTEKRQASIDALPFSDAEFDTVTCHEVLEHLPLPVYAKAISEIARVAKCFIVTCEPYKQNLAASLSKCPSRLARFNADFHVRRYDEQNGDTTLSARLLQKC
jgi:ubiquinone/menaquinone biosynthesis C-methylase UbiE